jgi:competence protein ComEC
MHSTRDSVDLAIVGGTALTVGGLAIVAPMEVAAAAAVFVLLAYTSRRVGLLAPALLALGLGVGAVRARGAVEAYEAEARQADARIPEPVQCAGRARVASSPVEVRGVLRWDGALADADCTGIAWSGLATFYGGPADLAHGDEVDVVATLAAPQRFWNPASGDPRPGEAHRAVVRKGGTLDARIVTRSGSLLARIDRARAAVRGRIDATFAPDLAPMARALVLGESDLAPGDDLAFRASGLSHLLAVSGMHLVLVLALVVKTLEAWLVRCESVAGRFDAGRVAAALGIPAAWLYAEFAGAGGSTDRAAWMATAALAARALGRRGDAPRAFGLSMAAMAAADPLVAFDLSFALSAGATSGLLAFASPLGDRFEAAVPSRVARAVPAARMLATTLAASLPCVPMVARFAPTVPLGGVFANLVAVPVGESAALPLCLVHALLGGVPVAERGTALLASGALVVVRFVARVASIPALTASVPQPTGWQCVAIATGLAVIALGGKRRGAALAVCALAVLVLELLARREGSPAGVLRATFLDVGQGDSAIVDLPDGEALVIDGGGLVGSPIDVGERVLAPELRARRRTQIALAVLTHPHPDHFGGLASGLSAVRVGAIWDTGQGEREGVAGGYQALLDGARAHGVPVVSPEDLCGEHTIGGARVEVLAPCPTFSSDQGPNDNSFVLRISYGRRALLFVGDAERFEEGQLLANAAKVAGGLRADVLKVGHHGSRTSSSPAFLDAVAPSTAIISVGRRNRFGHPHVETLRALAAARIRVFRTDRDGAVVVTSDGESLDAYALGAPR